MATTYEIHGLPLYVLQRVCGMYCQRYMKNMNMCIRRRAIFFPFRSYLSLQQQTDCISSAAFFLHHRAKFEMDVLFNVSICYEENRGLGGRL